MAAHLYILTGASGCGKTTLLNQVAAITEDTANSELLAVRAPKYSEREVRSKDGILDDITHAMQIELGEFDIAYVINNVKYGIKIDPIIDLLAKGFNPFIILSDFRVIRQLKELLGPQAKTLYVSSAIDADRLRRIQNERLGFNPTDEQKRILSYHFARTSAAARLGWWDRVSDCMTDLETDWRAYATDAKSTEIRTEKIRAFHIRYIEHVNLFDQVILNYSENRPEDMASQVRHLIRNVDAFSLFKTKRYPPIFIVAAPSAAGKGILMEMLHFIGKDKVHITSKLARREPKKGDRRDGMIALLRSGNASKVEWPHWWTASMRSQGEIGKFPAEYNMRWVFHKQQGLEGTGTQYAVSSIEIQRNIDAGMPQILVSNMDQFEEFRKRWPNNTVFIYLHRLVSAEEHREYIVDRWKDDPVEAETRIAEKQYVHDIYVQRIAEFDHVLLNTGFKEDLYDQMFRLLECYRSLNLDKAQKTVNSCGEFAAG